MASAVSKRAALGAARRRQLATGGQSVEQTGEYGFQAGRAAPGQDLQGAHPVLGPRRRRRAVRRWRGRVADCRVRGRCAAKRSSPRRPRASRQHSSAGAKDVYALAVVSSRSNSPAKHVSEPSSARSTGRNWPRRWPRNSAVVAVTSIEDRTHKPSRAGRRCWTYQSAVALRAVQQPADLQRKAAGAVKEFLGDVPSSNPRPHVEVADLRGLAEHTGDVGQRGRREHLTVLTSRSPRPTTRPSRSRSRAVTAPGTLSWSAFAGQRATVVGRCCTCSVLRLTAQVIIVLTGC